MCTVYCPRKRIYSYGVREEGMTGGNTSKFARMDIAAIQDSGRAWLVACAGTITVALTMGMFRVMGILLVELMEVFDTSTAHASLLFTCFGITYTSTALLVNTSMGGVIHERAMVLIGTIVGSFGFILTFFAARIEHVTFSIGFCLGVSSQIGLCSALCITGKYFKNRLAIATSLVASGGSLGTLIWPAILEHLIKRYSFRGASLILGGVLMNCLVCVVIMRPHPERRTGSIRSDNNDEENGSVTSKSQFSVHEFVATQASVGEQQILVKSEHKSDANGASGARRTQILAQVLVSMKEFALIKQPDSKQKLSVSQIFALKLFKNPIFVLYQVFSLSVSLCNECIIQFYPAMLDDIGLEEYQCAFLLSLVGMCGLVGILVTGFVGDYIEKRFQVVALSQTAMLLAVVLNQFALTFWSQLIYAVTIGLLFGIPYSYRIALLKDFFLQDDLAKMIGLTLFVAGVGGVGGFPIIGWLRDYTGGYLVPLYLIGGLYFVNTVILLAMGLLQSSHRRKQGSA